MNRDDVHSRKESAKWWRETLSFRFFLALGQHELAVPVISWWVLRFIMSDRVSILRLRPRPKSFGQADDDRLHKRLVGVVRKKFSEFFNVDVAHDLEEVRVITNCFISGNIIEFRGGGTREWIRKKGVLGSRANGAIYSTPD